MFPRRLLRGPWHAMVAVLFLWCSAEAANTRPLATTKVHVVNVGSSVEFTLDGFDADTTRRSAPLVKVVTGLPSQGAFYDLASNYAKYGYTPKYDATGVVKSAPHAPEFSSRLIYVAPTTSSNLDNDMWDAVEFTASDGALTSAPGLLYFVGPSGTLLGSNFDNDKGGWSIKRGLGSHTTPILQWDAFSRGSLNQYIHATDNAIETAITADKAQWSFVAPQKYYRRNLIGAFQGSIDFTMAAFAGDFTKPRSNIQLLTLECASCDAHRGITLTVFATGDFAFTGAEKHFSIPLSAGPHLRKDPKNTLVTDWPSATSCEIVEVLQDLSAITLAGDFTKSAETIALDNFRIVAPLSQAALIPNACLCTNPGTRCA